MHEVNYIDVEQGTDEWLDLRRGLMSASEAYNLLATVRYGEAAGYKNYRAKLLMERLTGLSPDRYKTKQMEYGTETEGVARTMYSLTTGNIVRKSGIYIVENKKACASLDGEIGDDGLVEIKCREIANHIESIATGKVPDIYYKQIQFQLWVSNKKWGDYCSYADEMPDNARLFIQRIERDEDMITTIIEKVDQMEADIEKYTAIIGAYKG
jgi:putative phage-type endonuclease